jgi:hypothetical protein
VTAPATDPWQEAEDWAESLVWGSIDHQPIPLATAQFESGWGELATLVVSPGRVSLIGRIPGMSPGQARRFVALVNRGIAMAERPPAPAPAPVDNPVDNSAGG